MTKVSIILLITFALSACQSTTIAKTNVEPSKNVVKKNCSSEAPSTGSRVKKRKC